MELDTQQSCADMMDQMVTYASLTLPNAEDSEVLAELQKEAADNHKILPRYGTNIT